MAGWRVLSPSSPKARKWPTLLIKHDFQPTQYTVCVTDLIHIWQETLDRKGIIRRALQEDTSIDPSEGTDQLKLLLQHLQSAVDAQPNTTRKLLKADSNDNLVLALSVELPAPLQPLLWSISLKQKSRDVLFQQLLLPSFERSFQAQCQLRSLLSVVEEKDAVISRLVDRLEGSGIELSNAFPGGHTVRGSRAAVRESLFRTLPGLRAFDEDRWRKNNSGTDYAGTGNLFEEVFADVGDSKLADDWKPPGEWWTDISGAGESLNAGTSMASIRSPVKQTYGSYSASKEDNDDFQVQDISKLARSRDIKPQVLVKDSQPTQSGSLKSVPVPEEHEDSSTEDDEDDLDNPAGSEARAKSPQRTSPPPPPAQPTRLGKIGGKKPEAAKSPSPPPLPESKDRNSPDVVELSQAPPETKPRRLGKIGGRQQQKKAETRELPLRSSPEPPADSEPGDSAEQATSPGPTSRGSKAKSPPNETEEEKAERRRIELKHELEEKRRNPPKKKRRF